MSWDWLNRDRGGEAGIAYTGREDGGHDAECKHHLADQVHLCNAYAVTTSAGV